MSLLGRLIGRAVARLPSRRGPILSGVDADGLLVLDEAGERHYCWNEVERVVATSGAGLIGDTVLLAVAFVEGGTLVVPETDAHWPALVDAIAARLAGAEPTTEWRLRLLAAPDRPLELFRRQ